MLLVRVKKWALEAKCQLPLADLITKKESSLHQLAWPGHICSLLERWAAQSKFYRSSGAKTASLSSYRSSSSFSSPR